MKWDIEAAVNWPPLHVAMTIFWLILIPVAHITGWVQSSTFISDLSMVALVLSSGSWAVAAVVAKRQRDDANVADVIEKLEENV